MGQIKSRNKDLSSLYQVIKVINHWKQKRISKLLEESRDKQSKQNTFYRAKDKNLKKY